MTADGTGSLPHFPQISTVCSRCRDSLRISFISLDLAEAMGGVDSLVVHSDFLAVQFSGRTQPEHFSWLWLLDHSHDDSRWNATTSQRKADAPPCVDSLVAGVHAEVVEAEVHVHWSDGSPHGVWPIAMLAEVAGLILERAQPELWRSPPGPEAMVSR